MQIVCDYSYVFSTEKFLKIQNIHISRLFQNLFNSIRSQKCFNKNLLKFPIIIEKFYNEILMETGQILWKITTTILKITVILKL